MPYYHAFGLNIYAEFPCLFAEISPSTQIDVRIELHSAIPPVINPMGRNNWYEVSENTVLIKLNKIANYLIEGGNSIKVQALTVDFELVLLYLMSTAFFILLRQRGLLVVHGASIVLNNKCVLIAAAAGTGKSTLAAAFLNAGYFILGDDISAIQFSKEQAIVYPAYPYIKLCEDVLPFFSYNKAQLQSLAHKVNKYYVSIEASFYSKPLPLSQIFLLNVGQDRIISKLKGAIKLQSLLQHIHLSQLVDLQNLAEKTFFNAEQLAQRLPIYKLVRTVICAPQEIVEMMIAHFDVIN